MRWLYVTAAAVLLTLAVAKPVKAEEREVNMTCVVALMGDVQTIKDMHAAGVPLALVDHLILTDATNRGEARTLLMVIAGELYYGGLPAGHAHALLWHLCGMPLEKIENTPARERQPEGPYTPEPKDI